LFSNRRVVFLLASLCCLLWGSAYPAIKNGYAMFSIAPDDIASKMVFAGYRFVFAGLLLLLMAVFSQRHVFNLNVKNLRQITALGLTQTSLQYIFFYVGLAYTTGVKGSILNATGTFFSVILAHFIYHNDRLSPNKVVGCLVGFAGVMVVNFNRDLLDFHFTLRGEGFVVIAAFILSAATIYGKRISQTMDSIVLTGYQLAIGGVALTVVGYATGGALTGFTLKSSALLLYMVLLSSAAFALWTILLKYNRVGLVTIFNFLIPIFGAILSATFLGESILEWKNVIALALVCSGIWLVTREN
jgi:drug/metabolite transporter (DMT)-like permease